MGWVPEPLPSYLTLEGILGLVIRFGPFLYFHCSGSFIRFSSSTLACGVHMGTYKFLILNSSILIFIAYTYIPSHVHTSYYVCMGGGPKHPKAKIPR